MRIKLSNNNTLPYCVLHCVQNIQKSCRQKVASKWSQSPQYIFVMIVLAKCFAFPGTIEKLHLVNGKISNQGSNAMVILMVDGDGLVKEGFDIKGFFGISEGESLLYKQPLADDLLNRHS